MSRFWPLLARSTVHPDACHHHTMCELLLWPPNWSSWSHPWPSTVYSPYSSLSDPFRMQLRGCHYSAQNPPLVSRLTSCKCKVLAVIYKAPHSLGALVLWPHCLTLSYLFTSIQQHWPPCCFLSLWNILLPQGLCTCSSLWLKCSSLWYLCIPHELTCWVWLLLSCYLTQRLPSVPQPNPNPLLFLFSKLIIVYIFSVYFLALATKMYVPQEQVHCCIPSQG